MTTLKIIHHYTNNEEMPVGKWFIARHRLTGKPVVVQRTSWNINSYDDCAIYLNQDHVGYDLFHAFISNYELLTEVSEIEVR